MDYMGRIDDAEYYHNQKRYCSRLRDKDMEYVHRGSDGNRRYYHEGETEYSRSRLRYKDSEYVHIGSHRNRRYYHEGETEYSHSRLRYKDGEYVHRGSHRNRRYYHEGETEYSHSRLRYKDGEYVHRGSHGNRRYHHERETEYSHHRRRYNYSLSRVAADLPFDIICNILSMLPIKSLARFRAVSKCWNLLTQNPYFIDLRSKNSPLAFILPRNSSQDLTNFHMLQKLKDEWDSTHIPLEYNLQGLGLELVSTCNGLLCLLDNKSHLLFSGDIRQMHIYNPITKYHMISPLLIYDRGDWTKCMRMGLGYDAETNKYKLLLIHISTNLVVHIITLGENHWRKVTLPKELGVQVKFVEIYHPYFVKGEMYWMLEMKYIDGVSDSVLVAMDIAKQEIRIIKLIDPPTKFTECCIVPFQDHISLIVKTLTWIHIWDLIDNRHGIWSHRESISNDQLHVSDYDKITVLGTTKDENILLGETRKWGSDRIYSYNLKTKKLTLQSFKDELERINCRNMFSFVPSLVSIRH